MFADARRVRLLAGHYGVRARHEALRLALLLAFLLALRLPHLAATNTTSSTTGVRAHHEADAASTLQLADRAGGSYVCRLCRRRPPQSLVLQVLYCYLYY